MRSCCLVFLLVFCAAAQSATREPDAGPRVTARARALARSALVVDTHADTTQWMLPADYDFTRPDNPQMVSLAKARAGGLKAEFFSIWVEPRFTGHYAQRTLDLIDAVRRQVEQHPAQMGLATSAADVRRLAKQGRFAALMGIEGGHSIEADLAELRDYFRLGVRYMTLTWSNSNEWADSSGDQNDPHVAHHDGLTPFGRQVVAEMNRLGMLVDLSHVSDKTFWDALAVTRAPVITSHSSARALTSAPRNLSDAMLRAIAKNGGTVQVNFYSAFLSQEYYDRNQALRAAAQAFTDPVEKQWGPDWTNGYPHIDAAQRAFAAQHLPRPPFHVLMDHLVHIIDVAGIDHVGLGSDWDGIESSPQGMDSSADVPRIVQGLLDRGYSGADIRKLLGGNILRVLRVAEQVARQQATRKQVARQGLPAS